MIHDLRNPGAAVLPREATAVVGTGSAALALALGLAEAGEPVVMVEAADDDEADDGYRSGELEPAPAAGRAAQRWQNHCMRLQDIDLRSRFWVAHSGWPVPMTALDKHYLAAERFVGASAPDTAAAKGRRPGRAPALDWNPDLLEDDWTETLRRQPLDAQHRRRLLALPNLVLVRHATAARVLLQDGLPVAVEVRDERRQPMNLRARRVVLAAGAVENARLLMLSDEAGVGLGDGRQHTGCYYQDHPVIRTAQIVPHDARVLQQRYDTRLRGGQPLFPKLRLTPHAQRQNMLLDATAVFELEQRRQRSGGSMLGAAWSRLAGAWRRAPADGRASALWLQVWLEQVPDAANRITLDGRRDVRGLPLPRLAWRCSDLELRTSRQLTRWIADELQRMNLAEVRMLAPMHDDPSWRDAVDGAAMPAGTTRMSVLPEDGVVDPQLQVHGVAGLFVLGSSVFPTIGCVHPELTVVALALRLAAHLHAMPLARAA